MRIGEVARRTGASVKAIRHYEAIGLLGPVPRRGSYRDYREQDVQSVLLIRQAQAAGMVLAQLQGLRREDGEPDWARLQQSLAARDAELAVQQQQLAAWRAALATAQAEIAACLAAGRATVADCTQQSA